MSDQRHPLRTSPHRGFFLLGTFGLVAWMSAWLLQRWYALELHVPGGWLHGWLMMFGALAPFIAGFLYTAYPRWLGQPEPPPWRWLTVLALQAMGLVLLAVGAWASPALASSGSGLLLLAWLLLLGDLILIALRGQDAELHALAMIYAVILGIAALLALLAWQLGGAWQLAFLSLRVGFWGFLLGVYLVVAHRMIPFFASCVLEDYTPWRPAWLLLSLLGLALLHLVLELRHAQHLRWLSAGPMTVLTAVALVRWQFWRARGNGLLAALFVAWTGLAIGLAATTAQSAWLHATGEFVALRAPQHLIGIGFFAAMVIAMGTRVTLGHSGRPLRLSALAAWAMAGIVLAAVLRAGADLPNAPQDLIWASGALWVAAALLWALRHAPMLIRPRSDGKPG